MDDAQTAAEPPAPAPQLPLAFELVLAVPVLAVILWFIVRWWPRSEDRGDGPV